MSGSYGKYNNNNNINKKCLLKLLLCVDLWLIAMQLILVLICKLFQYFTVVSYINKIYYS